MCEIKLFILYKKECIIILFIISTFTKKSPATYASMLIKTNWNQNLLCYYFFLKQKFWNLNDFDTTLSFGGIRWFVCTCSDNLDKCNKFSSKLHKNDIHWYTWGKWRWRGWHIAAFVHHWRRQKGHFTNPNQTLLIFPLLKKDILGMSVPW